MGMWSFYFIAKMYLYYNGSIHIDVFWNILFLVFIVLPAPKMVAGRRAFTIWRVIVNLSLAFFLLWHDSWLPPFFEAGAHLNEQGMPSLGYIIYFLAGFFSLSGVIILSLLLLGCYLFRNFRIMAGVVAVLLLMPLIPPLLGIGQSQMAEAEPQAIQKTEKIEDLNKYVESFYGAESDRVILFKQGQGRAYFDIVIMHVCSLSWDDLKDIAMLDNPFFKQFDYMLTGFNTVTAYSNPAVMRLFQANCGQRPHDDIHKTNEISKACLLFESLNLLGYETSVSMNHDGKYGNFTDEIKKYGLGNAPTFMPSGTNNTSVFFDNSPLYNDYSMLEKWWKARLSSKSAKAALYYNTVNLHAGSHWSDEKKWWTRDRKDQYKDVTSVLLTDISKFIGTLKASGRNVVVVFVPEHGRALHGNAIQGPDLRDIPLPRITKAPVGIKFIGPKFNNVAVNQQIISKPTSYLAVSWMLSKFIENSPFGDKPMSADDIKNKIPKTDFVNENQGNKIVEIEGKYYYYGKEKKWLRLTPEQLN
ncbi:cellulose biosynthesis protein BcsG [bacterium]|nr:MAG: cellulose biosynthesis protein BcsG [bacterium]